MSTSSDTDERQIELPEFLRPGFDIHKKKVAEIRAILNQNRVKFNGESRKSGLVQAFQTEVEPYIDELVLQYDALNPKNELETRRLSHLNRSPGDDDGGEPFAASKITRAFTFTKRAQKAKRGEKSKRAQKPVPEKKKRQPRHSVTVIQGDDDIILEEVSDESSASEDSSTGDALGDSDASDAEYDDTVVDIREDVLKSEPEDVVILGSSPPPRQSKKSASSSRGSVASARHLAEHSGSSEKEDTAIPRTSVHKSPPEKESVAIPRSSVAQSTASEKDGAARHRGSAGKKSSVEKTGTTENSVPKGPPHSEVRSPTAREEHTLPTRPLPQRTLPSKSRSERASLPVKPSRTVAAPTVSSQAKSATQSSEPEVLTFGIPPKSKKRNRSPTPSDSENEQPRAKIQRPEVFETLQKKGKAPARKSLHLTPAEAMARLKGNKGSLFGSPTPGSLFGTPTPSSFGMSSSSQVSTPATALSEEPGPSMKKKLPLAHEASSSRDQSTPKQSVASTEIEERDEPFFDYIDQDTFEIHSLSEYQDAQSAEQTQEPATDELQPVETSQEEQEPTTEERFGATAPAERASSASRKSNVRFDAPPPSRSGLSQPAKMPATPYPRKSKNPLAFETQMEKVLWDTLTPEQRQRFSSSTPGPQTSESVYSTPAGNLKSVHATPQTAYRTATNTPRTSYSTPGESFTTPRESFATPRESFATPRESFATPRESFATPRESFATLREQFTTPHSGRYSQGTPQTLYQTPAAFVPETPRSSYFSPFNGGFPFRSPFSSTPSTSTSPVIKYQYDSSYGRNVPFIEGNVDLSAPVKDMEGNTWHSRQLDNSKGEDHEYEPVMTLYGPAPMRKIVAAPEPARQTGGSLKFSLWNFFAFALMYLMVALYLQRQWSAGEEHLGYCDTDSDTNARMTSWYYHTPYTKYIVSACKPCPERGECNFGKVSCPTLTSLRSHGYYSRHLLRNRDKCEETSKTVRLIDLSKDRISLLLKQHRGALQCENKHKKLHYYDASISFVDLEDYLKGLYFGKELTEEIFVRVFDELMSDPSIIYVHSDPDHMEGFASKEALRPFGCLVSETCSKFFNRFFSSIIAIIAWAWHMGTHYPLHATGATLASFGCFCFAYLYLANHRMKQELSKGSRFALDLLQKQSLKTPSYLPVSEVILALGRNATGSDNPMKNLAAGDKLWKKIQQDLLDSHQITVSLHPDDDNIQTVQWRGGVLEQH